MSKIHASTALAALIAAAAMPCAPAHGQQLPSLFLQRPQMQTAPQAYAPDVVQPDAVQPDAMQPDAGPSGVDDENSQLAPRLQRQVVAYPSREAPGTVIIDTPHTYLYYVLGNGKAMRYGIGVGRQGFTWSGVKSIARKTEWPDWYPPPEMIARQPYLPRMIAGGPGNPLGARAMYIGGTEYRIHGTNDPSSIGKFMSSGCIRMTNDNAIDLYSRVQIGAKVIVLPMQGQPKIEAKRVPAWQAKAQDAIDDSAPTPERTSWSGSRPTRLY
jgi:lipoprotein-anchoring transpeptidase ErfK/SrfK